MALVVSALASGALHAVAGPDHVLWARAARAPRARRAAHR